MMRRSSTLSAAVLCVGALLTSSEALCSDPSGWITPVFNSGAVVTGAAAFAPESAKEGVAKSFGYSAPLDGIFLVPPGSPPTEAFSLGLPESVPSQSGARIVETARALGYNWAQCYLFVRNQIRFSPNRGVLRGPERTLLDREGNDADQAFLLLALLRASGYADTAVRYADGVGSFVSMPLGGSAEGYDAASWTGVPSTGTVMTVAGRVANVLNGNAIWIISTNSTVLTSKLYVEHFWVRIRLNSSWYDLDPSFKPRQRTPRSDTLPSDMGYDRALLLQKVGGTARLAYSVSGLDANRLEGELDRLATNLVERWRSSDRDLPVSAVIGTDEIVPQDLAEDPSVFHGTTNGSSSVDFLAQTNAFKNALRYALRLEHAGFTNTFWLDEVNTRRLWLSYTNSSQAFPRAVLHVGDGTWATEPAGGSVADDPLTIRVAFPDTFRFTNTAAYALSRSTNNVYAVPVGFGADHRGGMRDLAQQELNRSLGADDSAQGPGVRSRVLQVIGQQWHAQTAMMGELIGQMEGKRSQTLYQIGVSGQA